MGIDLMGGSITVNGSRPELRPTHVPYRIDIPSLPTEALDVLVELGALDVESNGAGLAAILPDAVLPDAVAGALGVKSLTVSAAVARDNGSVWLLSPRPVRFGSIAIAPADAVPAPGILRLADSQAFGTGHHPTTALCLEALQEILSGARIDSILDVGTGSGILALAALMMGVPHAVGVDVEGEALQAAANNARLNGLEGRLQLVRGPEAVEGYWPLIVANILAAPLIEMAPALVRRLRSGGRLILSGIPQSLESEVRQTYRHMGIGHTDSHQRGGWTALVARASW
jgi:ribosomal protein L11 methyltransferase